MNRTVGQINEIINRTVINGIMRRNEGQNNKIMNKIVKNNKQNYWPN